MSEEERREERRAANRRSAFESRQCRKVLIKELQDTVRAMPKENATVRKEADSLKAQVDMLLRDNRQLRGFQQQLSNFRMPMTGMSDAQSPHQLGGGSIWGMQKQQQQQQQCHHQLGMNTTTGGMAGFSALDQYLNAEAHHNVGPMVGMQSGIEEASNPTQAPPTNALLDEQAQEYLRGLLDRNNPML